MGIFISGFNLGRDETGDSIFSPNLRALYMRSLKKGLVTFMKMQTVTVTFYPNS